MGEPIWTRVTFGGTVKRSDMEHIANLIANEMFCESSEWSDPLEELEAAAMEGRAAIGLVGETNYGRAETLVNLLTELRLHWRRVADARFEYGGDITFHWPDIADDQTCEAPDGTAALTLRDLKAAAEKGQSLADVIASLAWSEAEPPPLVIVDE